MMKGIALKPFFFWILQCFFTLKNTKECISIAVLDFNKIHQIIDVIQNAGVTSVNMKKIKKLNSINFYLCTLFCIYDSRLMKTIPLVISNNQFKLA